MTVLKVKVKAGHDLPQLLDQLLAANLMEEGRTLTYDSDDPLLLIIPARDGATEAQLRKVVEPHVPEQRKVPPTRAELKAKVSAATSWQQLRAAVLEMFDTLPG